jgi:hypothetical protein
MPAPVTPLDSDAQISCPAGTVVWGGGTAIAGISGPAETIDTSAPGGPTSWRARVSNPGPGAAQAANGGMDVLAICGHKPAGYRIVRASGTAGPTGTPVVITGGPGCPHGTSVIGGGARVGAPLPSTPLAQAIDGGSGNWVSTIVRTGTQPVTDTFSTICAA